MIYLKQINAQQPALHTAVQLQTRIYIELIQEFGLIKLPRPNHRPANCVNISHV